VLKLLLSITFITSLYSQSASEFKNNQISGFKEYKKSQIDDFKKYKNSQEKAYTSYKKNLSTIWSKPKLSTKKSLVSYTSNMKTRTDIDFENETIEIETISNSAKQAQEKLKIALAKAITINTKTLHENDPLQKILDKIKKPKNIITSKVKEEPILSTVIFNKKPTKKSVKAYVENKIVYDEIKIKESKKLKDEKVYSVKINLPKDTMLKRSRVYLHEVKKQAKIQELPVALVFAVMHTESNFNPRARSLIPAFGLMQIVPKSAGIDSYLYLYNKKKLVSSSYLYNSRNNITMGSAYLHILYYRYLRKIKNETSRLYCTIAAYNTGAGNVAWAFVGKKNVNLAAPIINAMGADDVYKKLLKDLKYNEPKRYLQKVNQRMTSYQKIYG